MLGVLCVHLIGGALAILSLIDDRIGDHACQVLCEHLIVVAGASLLRGLLPTGFPVLSSHLVVFGCLENLGLRDILPGQRVERGHRLWGMGFCLLNGPLLNGL